MSLRPLLVRYLEYSAAIGRTESTVERRRGALNAFIGWCEERSLTQPHDITRPVLERYRRHLYALRRPNGKPLGLATQRNRLTDVKQWFKWLTQENYIASDPASGLVLPRPHRRLPKAILSRAEVANILAQTKNAGPLGIRDRAILETFYATGIRRMELVNLTLYDIDFEQGTLMVRQGKGRKDRLLPIGQTACRWVEQYLADIRPDLVVDPNLDTLFLTDFGEPFIKGRLTALVRRYLNAANIDKPGACHLFRHTMATLMLENGADLRFIQAMLGHADISTTTIYTQVSIRKLKEVYGRTHPGSQMTDGRLQTTDSEPTQAEILERLASEADEDPE